VRPLTRWIVFPALLAVLVACGDSARERPAQELVGSTMGTTFSIKVIAPPESLDLAGLRRDVEAALDGINGAMSTYLSDSELSRFNASDSTDWIEVSAELCRAIEAARVVSEFTGGAFDVTVGPLVNLWGFGPTESTYKPPPNDAISSAMQYIGYSKLHADCSMPALRKDAPGVYVDLSAFAKGHAADVVADLLDARTLPDYLIEIGGEMRMRGTNARSEPWAIAIEKPDRAGRSIQTVVHLTDSAMATSGDYRNYFEHEGRFYSHTIDPRTGYPVTHDAASVTVIAQTAGFADAAATALLVLGPDAGMKLAEQENIAAYFLLRIGTEFEERMSSLFATKVLKK